MRLPAAPLTLLLIIALPLLTVAAARTAAAPIGTPPFQRTWERTDRPVADGAVSRTWMWGPEPFTGVLTEPYLESPGGARQVQYFDKSRMELTHPDGDPNNVWYVTNGLLVVEMVEGFVQTGDGARDDTPVPADVALAGDPGQQPTYAYIDRFQLRATPARPAGTLVDEWATVHGIRDASTNPLPETVYATERLTVPGIDHTIAAPFWDFMNASGTVYEEGQLVTARLFQDPYYATGYPITEAYWSVLRVGGVERNVLWQCFERRCLTYTPSNPPDWRVEMGNVGRHYHAWRYPTEPARWQPARVISWQIQFTGTLDFSLPVAMYDLDLFDTDTADIAALRARGVRVVCYLSVGAWEDWRPDADAFPESVLGADNGWPGERWLDIRRLDVLGPIMEARLDLARDKGCDGVDPDNVDGWTNDTGFPLTAADQLAFNRFIANAARARGLAVGLKNDGLQVGDLLASFDFAVVEQCFEYEECDLYQPFVTANKPVFAIEYDLTTAEFCPEANARDFNAIRKRMALDTWVEPCR